MPRLYIVTTSVLVLLIEWRHIQCNNYTVYLKGTNGNITSPGYPDSYPRNSVFGWLITVSEDHYITLEIKDFILQSCRNLSSECNFDTCEYCDFVEISYDTTFFNYCSRAPPPRYISSEGNTMNITFHTNDRLFRSRGFWLYYQAYISCRPCNPSRPPPNEDYIDDVIAIASMASVAGLVVLVLLCYGLKKCLCTCVQQQNHPEDHPSSFNAQPDLSDEQFQSSVAPPPRYEEVARSSQSNINITPPFLDANGEGSTDIEAYDSSGLPSYNEALKISQMSNLNRT